MLTLYTSNSMTRLAATLAADLGRPLASPLTPELVVTPGPAMARWVNLQLCRAGGIVANIDYPLPATTVWDLAKRVLGDLPDEDPFAREALAWRIYALLPGLLDRPAFAPLKAYLHDDPGELKHWQLAEQVADVFDRYQLYRPALIRAWLRGEADDWQAQLWQQLLETHADLADKHRVASVDRLLARLQNADRATLPGLPERLSLFAVTTLPPLFVEVFNGLSTVTTVKLYLPSPTPHYWADLSTRRELAVRRLKDPSSASLWTVGNALLASWGRQGQAFQDLLLAPGPDHQHLDAFEAPAGDTLLSRIQRDIYEVDADDGIPPVATVGIDDSLSIHICHSAMRECQVMRDHLLACMQQDPDLRPEDVLVLIPEITAYAPVIEAVFGQRRRGDADNSLPFIPWNLSDIAPLDEHPLVRSFLTLLDLPDSRLSHSEVLSYLDVTAITERFGLDTDGIGWLREQMQLSRVRWGWDAAHKAEFGLPETSQNTWQQTLDRLFAGYAFGADDDKDAGHGLFHDIAPLAGVDGDNAETLGKFRGLIGHLNHYRRQLAQDQDPAGWCRLLSDMLDDLFEQRDEDQGKVQQIRDAVADLEQLATGGLDSDGHDAGTPADTMTLAPALVRHWLSERLGTETRGGRFFRGGITFCGMKPMRGLPFKRIYLLGMQDQAFPRRTHTTEFDQMTDTWEHGDPRPGDEDRYLFLEALLAAQDGLAISYTGRNPKDNSERQPSVLVRELLDYLDERFHTDHDPDDGMDDDAATPPFSRQLSTVHSLQAYSRRNYRRPDSASFDGYWRKVGETLSSAAPKGSNACWPDRVLPTLAETAHEIPIDQLRRFLLHPPRYFVHTRLAIYLGDDNPAPEDDEAFAIDGLQGYFVKQDLLDAYLNARSADIEQFSARGALPHSGLGKLAFQQVRSQTTPWLEQLDAYRGRQAEAVLIDLDIDLDSAPDSGPAPDSSPVLTHLQLSGQLANHYPGIGLLHAYPSRLKGRHLLSFWLDYLLLTATQVQASGDEAHLVSADQNMRITTPLSADQARQQLRLLLQYYLDGLDRPLPLLPNSSFAYALDPEPPKRGPPLDEQQARRKAAYKAWSPGDFSPLPGEQDDPYIQLLTRDLSGSPLDHPEFPSLAMAFYGPALRHVGN